MINLKDLKLVKKVRAKMFWDPSSFDNPYISTSRREGLGLLLTDDEKIQFIFSEKLYSDDKWDVWFSNINAVSIYKIQDRTIYYFSHEEVQGEEWHFILSKNSVVKKNLQQGKFLCTFSRILLNNGYSYLSNVHVITLKAPQKWQVIYTDSDCDLLFFNGKEYENMSVYRYETILIAKAIKGDLLNIPDIGTVEVKREWIDENRVKTIATINGKIGEAIKHPDDEDKPELGGAIAAIRALKS